MTLFLDGWISLAYVFLGPELPSYSLGIEKLSMLTVLGLLTLSLVWGFLKDVWTFKLSNVAFSFCSIAEIMDVLGFSASFLSSAAAAAESLNLLSRFYSTAALYFVFGTGVGLEGLAWLYSNLASFEEWSGSEAYWSWSFGELVSSSLVLSISMTSDTFLLN